MRFPDSTNARREGERQVYIAGFNRGRFRISQRRGQFSTLYARGMCGQYVDKVRSAQYPKRCHVAPFYFQP
jgi:hypothetical protein